MSRIFNSRGIVIIDYDKLEVEAYLAEARAAGCRCITVNVPEGQLLYLGNRTSDALAAVVNDNCEVFFSDCDKPGAEGRIAGNREPNSNRRKKNRSETMGVLKRGVRRVGRCS